MMMIIIIIIINIFVDQLILMFPTPLIYHTKASLFFISVIHRGADKPLARPGRKQANVSVRMA